MANSNWRPGLLVGLLLALEFLQVGQALRLTSASHTVMFLYTAPIFIALGQYFRLLAERLNGVHWCGITLAFQSIVVYYISLVVWFWLLRHYLASLFSVAFGIWLLHEPQEMSFVLGALLVLAGVVLVTNHAWFQARLGR